MYQVSENFFQDVLNPLVFVAIYDTDGKLIKYFSHHPVELPACLITKSDTNGEFESETLNRLEEEFAPYPVLARAGLFQQQESLFITGLARTPTNDVFDLLPIGLIHLDSVFQIAHSNRFAQVLLGLDNNEILSLSLIDLLGVHHFNSGRQHFENLYDPSPYKLNIEIVSPLGRKVRLAVLISRSLLSVVDNGYLMILQDITQEFESNQKLEFLASHDPLTHCFNREALLARVVDAVTKDTIGNSALIYLDVNKFKQLNDTYGHAAGDQGLIHVSQSIRKIIRTTDVLTRIGGDEFVVLLFDVYTQAELEGVANKFKRSIGENFEFEGRKISIEVSIGIATWNEFYELYADRVGEDSGDYLEEWLKIADKAMYESKHHHQGEVVYFHKTLLQNEIILKEQRLWLLELIEKQHLDALLHPSYCDQKIIAFEVEVTLPDNKWGIRGSSVLQLLTLPKQVMAWQAGVVRRVLLEFRAQPRYTELELHMEAPHWFLSCQSCIELMVSQLEEFQVHPQQVVFFIHELDLMNDHQNWLQVCESLKQRGFQIGIRDFGHSFSAYQWFNRVTFNHIKSWGAMMPTDQEDRVRKEIICSLIDLANRLGVKFTIDGIQNKEQLQLLGDLKGVAHQMVRTRQASERVIESY